MQAVEETDKTRAEFILWYKNCLGFDYHENVETTLQLGLSRIGIKSESIFSESDTQKLRLYISELVLKRQYCGIDESKEYLSSVSLLTSYVEYLEKKTKLTCFTADRKDKSNDSLTVAYYLSKANMVGVKLLGYRRFSEAFNDIALLLNQKPSTIKNMRDEFDPYFDNGRKGWHQRSLCSSRKKIFDRYANISIENLTVIVKELLASYKVERSLPDTAGTEHKMITITNKKMKEIKSTGK